MTRRARFRPRGPGVDTADAPWSSWDAAEDEPLPRAEVLGEMSTMLRAAEGEAGGGFFAPEFVDVLAVALASGLHLEGRFDRVDWADQAVEPEAFPRDPAAFLTVLAAGADADAGPQVTARSEGVTTLGVTLVAPDDVAEAFGYPVPDGELEVDVPDGGDLPSALRLHVESGDTVFDLEVRFTGWDAPVDIEVPAATAPG